LESLNDTQTLAKATSHSSSEGANYPSREAMAKNSRRVRRTGSDAAKA
jgi:hypothetical protein